MITKICTISGQEFVITDEDLKFYEKMGVPTPALCPDERCRRRLSWQNMRKLYRRKCDATGKVIISNISTDKPFTVYKQDYWWSDAWDFHDYGRDFDFDRSFFDQWQDLFLAVPQPCMLRNHLLDENSEFTNFAGSNKDCYLIFHADMNRDCLYGVGVKKCTDCVDITHVHSSELLYECVDCRDCYNVRFSQNAENCSDSLFLKNCIGCKNCFGCVNLRNKEFYYLNEPLTKSEYEAKIAALQLEKHSSLQSMQAEFPKFLKKFPHKATEGYQNEDCFGDQVFHSQNVKDSFDVQESRDMRYCHRIYNGPNSDCYDVNEYGMNIQQIYEGLAIGINSNRIIAGIYVNEQVSDIYYGMHNHHSQHCFGCIGAVKAEYCILNKQYSKKEYEDLLPKIITHMKQTGEWGEFFPSSMSPFAYNETVAQEYFPLDKTSAETAGYTWKQVSKTSKYIGEDFEIPETITDIPADICDKILTCEQTGQHYRVQPAELSFYQKMSLPLPRLHPDVRHLNRMGLRNPRQLWSRQCAECKTNIQTTFAPDRPEKVLCENCYLNVVI